MSRRVLIAVTHLLGAGHLTRAASLGRAFARAGHAVTLVSGGMPAPLVGGDGLSLVQLPPVGVAGVEFGALIDEAGRPVSSERLDARRRLLVEAFERARPDILVTELFPFGRRVLAQEFLALVEAARARTPRPLVACSIRDILVASPKANRIAETHRRVVEGYDLVLVHGDPDLVSLEASWPVDDSVRPLLRYTGYVDEGRPVDPAPDRQGILVSGGSSASALPLLRTGIEAARLVPGHRWRILAGHGIPEDAFRGLSAAAPAHVAVERARADFRQLLAASAVSVSQAGYNTAVDLLRTRTAAVLVPFEAGRETEQRLRAERLAERGYATLVPEAELSPERLAVAVEGALERRGPLASYPNLNGAERSVAILFQALAAPARSGPAFDWAPLRAAFRRARDQGFEPLFWWRDDDAVSDTPALRRLLLLAAEHACPVAVAAIPSLADASLGPALREGGAAALVHGWAHANHAAPDAKKAEFGAGRPPGVLRAEAASALAAARAALGESLLPVFVPPWNRLAPSLVPQLFGLGYAGLSAFNDRSRESAPAGLAQVNTHLDPIDWHGARGLADPAALVEQLAGAVDRRTAGAADPGEPIGLLTHHLVHDEAVWRFCAALLEELARNSASFALAHDLFCVRQPDRRGAITR